MLRDVLLIALLALAMLGFARSPTGRSLVSGQAFLAPNDDALHCKCGDTRPWDLKMEGLSNED